MHKISSLKVDLSFTGKLYSHTGLQHEPLIPILMVNILT